MEAKAAVAPSHSTCTPVIGCQTAMAKGARHSVTISVMLATMALAEAKPVSRFATR